MIRAFSAFALSALLAGCQSINDVCDTFLGDYAGTFEGDAAGTVTITITTGEEDAEALASFTLEGDSFSAIGSGHVHCEDGELEVDILDDDGNVIGTITGSMIEGGGGWELGSGESGTWSVE
jgi:hypothetical protein